MYVGDEVVMRRIDSGMEDESGERYGCVREGCGRMRTCRGLWRAVRMMVKGCSRGWSGVAAVNPPYENILILILEEADEDLVRNTLISRVFALGQTIPD